MSSMNESTSSHPLGVHQAYQFDISSLKHWAEERETARKEWSTARKWLHKDRVHLLLLRNAASEAKQQELAAEGAVSHTDDCDASKANEESLLELVGMGECEENEWSASFRHLLESSSGRSAFTTFLQSEYADENILYFNAIEQLGARTAEGDFVKFANDVYNTFVTTEAPLEVNISREMRKAITEGMSVTPMNRLLFLPSVKHIYMLMEKDSYTRFRRTTQYKQWHEGNNDNVKIV